ncbi:MAG: hypothetical protein WC516_06655 [Patescibacteria group bacterium]|jgi:hypothetical protein
MRIKNNLITIEIDFHAWFYNNNMFMVNLSLFKLTIKYCEDKKTIDEIYIKILIFSIDVLFKYYKKWGDT